MAYYLRNMYLYNSNKYNIITYSVKEEIHIIFLTFSFFWFVSTYQTYFLLGQFAPEKMEKIDVCRSVIDVLRFYHKKITKNLF